MCGIAGFAGVPLGQAESADRIRSMCDAIRHRGPDSAGYFVADGIAMGMRRLSIIDVGGGQQPISNEDDSVTVVFNGEIYNHHELRRELESRGHRFRTHSDTEVLVHLYEDLGSAMVPRLHGMFAFSIWDGRRKTLLIARDHTGMKPLSYLDTGSSLVYGSELRSLWTFHPGRLRVDADTVMRYLAFGYVPEPYSIFAGVKKLPPGHLLTWSAGQAPRVERYWSAPVAEPDIAKRDVRELVETLRERLDFAVGSHLESEVPLGAFLSGGLDSSTVVALMCRRAAGRVKTFSIGFAESEFDESAAARAVARELGTQHTELIVKPDVEAMFEAVAAMFDEPFADSSAIPTFLVSQLARQAVTVALSGDGGDELFGGYTRYSRTLSGGAGAGPLWGKILTAAALCLPHFAPGRGRLLDAGRSRWGRYAATVVQPVRLDEGGVALPANPSGQRHIEAQLAEHIAAQVGEDFAASMMRVDLQTYLPGDILTKVDRTSMAVSLEARVPFLDFDLVDFALRLPGSMRVTANETKRLFRKAIAGIVPTAVQSRPKMGFSIPLEIWFRHQLRHRVEALRQPSLDLREFVDVPAVNRLVFEHVIGRRDHSVMLWRLIVLDNWLAALKRGALLSPPAVPVLAA